ncbi:MAG: Asp-tRNA(Asn)/Glu-tRNA(Gln) amidotransferase subunit GatC [Candidatus Saccharimonadales bacterium]
MTKLSRDDILKLARLSRLTLSEAEIDIFAEEISAILHYTEQLQSVDLDGVEPTYQVTGLKDVTRPDEIVDYGTTPAQLMKNAPATEDGHFKVKRMLA